MITADNNDFFSLGLDGSLWYGNGQMTKEKGAIEYPAVIMQYTGLKDKNGVEIYEGDVVSIGRKEPEIYVVKWIGQRFYPALTSFTVEVIGNIYENPELLDGKM